MSEEEILARLRDIDVPKDTGVAMPADFALWPFVALGVLVALVLVLRFVGRNRWRRAARGELARILSVPDAGARWSELLVFATGLSERSGRSLALPATAFHRPEAVGEDERAAFVAFLQAELAR